MCKKYFWPWLLECKTPVHLYLILSWYTHTWPTTFTHSSLLSARESNVLVAWTRHFFISIFVWSQEDHLFLPHSHVCRRTTASPARVGGAGSVHCVSTHRNEVTVQTRSELHSTQNTLSCCERCQVHYYTQMQILLALVFFFFSR